MMASLEGFTPTQKRMLEVLADGAYHRREELHACLGDELSPISSIRVYLSNMRKLLRPQGETISCETRDGVTYYRHARIVASPNDGQV